MKIAIIKDQVPLPFANIVNTLKNAQGYFNLGHKVEILTVKRFYERFWSLKKKEIHKFFDIDNKIIIKYFRGNLLFYFRQYFIVRPIIRFLKVFPKLYDFLDPEIEIGKYCVRNKFKFAYVRGLFRTAIYNINNKVPTVFEYHHEYISDRLKELLELINSKYFLGVITISDFLKQMFIKHGVPKEKILVVEDAVELEKFDKITDKTKKIRKILNLPLNKKLVLYTGNLRDEMGIDTILIATKLLNNKEYAFYFIGGNKRKEFKNWKRFVIKNKLKADINFLGYKPNKIIPYYLKAADILLAQYSRKYNNLNSHSPIKIFEYMGSKTPIIATAIGRITEICKNNECLFVNADDPIDLSEKIKILTKDKDLQNKLIQNAYQEVKKYTYKERCRKIIEFFM